MLGTSTDKVVMVAVSGPWEQGGKPASSSGKSSEPLFVLLEHDPIHPLPLPQCKCCESAWEALAEQGLGVVGLELCSFHAHSLLSPSWGCSLRFVFLQAGSVPHLWSCVKEQKVLPGLEVFLTSVKTSRADLFPKCLSTGVEWELGIALCLAFDRVLSCSSFKALFAFPLPFKSHLLKFQSCTKAQTQDS